MYLLLGGLCLAVTSMAQTDTTVKPAPAADTLRVGNMIIIKKGGEKHSGSDTEVQISTRKYKRNPNVSTNWIILDLGFSNYVDNTNYAGAAAQAFAPGSNKNWFDLRTGKSVNVNIWLFMQRLNLVQHVLNLKYGIGIELNNYRYEENIRYAKNPPLVYKDVIEYSKNKLAADYVTVPLMLNFNFTPNNPNHKSFGLSVGASAGYLYSSRQKFISDETGKEKTKGNLGLEPFKLSYIAELQLGPVKLYGSMATKSMFEDGLDQKPYNVGIRFSNW